MKQCKKVELLIAGDYVDEDKDDEIIFENRAGGSPLQFASSKMCIDAALYTCARCDCKRQMLVQLFCPLPSSPYRTVCVFACLQISCESSSDRLLALSLNEREIPKQNNNNINENIENDNIIFDGYSGENISNSDIEHLLATLSVQPPQTALKNANAEKVITKIQTKKFTKSKTNGVNISEKKTLNQNSRRKSFTDEIFPFYLCTVDEPSSSDRIRQQQKKALALAHRYEQKNASDNDESIEDESVHFTPELYEVDKHEKKLAYFMDTLNKLPQQCVRYSLSGCALNMFPSAHLNSSITNEINASRIVCSQCASTRVFEFELMPHLLSCLDEARCSSDHHASLTSLFVTASVYSCLQCSQNINSNIIIEYIHIENAL